MFYPSEGYPRFSSGNKGKDFKTSFSKNFNKADNAGIKSSFFASPIPAKLFNFYFQVPYCIYCIYYTEFNSNFFSQFPVE